MCFSGVLEITWSNVVVLWMLFKLPFALVSKIIPKVTCKLVELKA